MVESWEQAGQAWGSRAAEWATITEPPNLAVYRDVLDMLGASAGESLVDVACGSGAALREAARRGLLVSGIDAAAGLVEVAQEQVPDGDLAVGDLKALPWAADEFDIAVSFNGVWNVEPGISEVARVLRPAGRFGFSWWGPNNELAAVMTPSDG